MLKQKGLIFKIYLFMQFFNTRLWACDFEIIFFYTFFINAIRIILYVILIIFYLQNTRKFIKNKKKYIQNKI